MSELARLCPICHQQNACAMALGQDIGRCWCADSSYNAVELIKQYVTTYPDNTIRSDQCVCVSCLSQIAQNTALEPCAVQFYTP
ncbi:cysteine-rich CWC family protein [Shewanella metallivivens]|uniref:Cysteine-rich CWC family protein n=1 Tax=Shewanella metallivivens TaxID=2872342 RepID=A0ABT5TN83_9GAMM|nr:cysteine-rich CWC family protein [Shewanella metallivivens]MDD8060042.1 cysteine-rich CWC family protein [Shewanella metallivivens]